MNDKDKEFLLRSYGEVYNPECGPWNLSLKSKWLEYEITNFFESNFNKENLNYIANIGIGVGVWDRYLAYWMAIDSVLVSIDKDKECCYQLELGLLNEGNPNKVIIVNEDIMNYSCFYKFDLVTMIGSTRNESGLYNDIFKKSFRMLSTKGSLFYSSLDKYERKDELLDVVNRAGYKIEKYEEIKKHNLKLILVKIVKK